MDALRNQVEMLDAQINQLESEVKDIQRQIDEAQKRHRVNVTWHHRALSAQRHKRSQIRVLVEEKRKLLSSSHPDRDLVKKNFPEIVKVLVQIARASDRAFDEDLSEDENIAGEKDTWAGLDRLDELWPTWRAPGVPLSAES